MALRWLDLFSGVGMYAKGLEEAGHEVVGFCEVDKFCHKILKKHWPMKPISFCVKSLTMGLMASLVAHRAKITPLRINPEKVSMEAVQDSSGRWCYPFAWYDQNTGCWRTFQRHLSGEYSEYLADWPASGMMRSGIAYQRDSAAHLMQGNAFTFLPTPAATEGKGCSRNRYRGSKTFKGSRTSEALRTCATDQCYLNPRFAEVIQGLPIDYTLLETETHHALLEN